MAIAPEFDLFYTQDPQTIPAYAENGISVRRCDLAIDPQLYYPETSELQCDVVFVGKWTAYRDALVRELARHCDLRVHGHAAESRWGLPVHPPLDCPDLLRRAMCGARLALDFALVEQPGNRYDGSFRMTPRVQIAAACGVACMIEDYAGLEEFFSPGVEIETFTGADDLRGDGVGLARRRRPAKADRHRGTPASAGRSDLGSPCPADPRRRDGPCKNVVELRAAAVR